MGLPEQRAPIEAKKRRTVEFTSFIRGVDEIAKRVNELLNHQSLVIIALSGSEHDVGKTSLAAAIRNKLMASHIPVEIVGNPTVLNIAYPKAFRTRGVLVLTEFYQALPFNPAEDHLVKGIQLTTKSQNELIINALKRQKIVSNGVNLRVAIFRKDKPFMIQSEERLFADIIIRNKHAVDKKR